MLVRVAVVVFVGAVVLDLLAALLHFRETERCGGAFQEVAFCREEGKVFILSVVWEGKGGALLAFLQGMAWG